MLLIVAILIATNWALNLHFRGSSYASYEVYFGKIFALSWLIALAAFVGAHRPLGRMRAASLSLLIPIVVYGIGYARDYIQTQPKWRMLVAFGVTPHLIATLLSEYVALRIGIVVIVATLLIALIAAIPRWQLRRETDLSVDKRLELVNEYRKTTAQIIGGAAIVIGLWLTYQQVTAGTRQVGLAERQDFATRMDQAVQRVDSTNPALYEAGVAQLGEIIKATAWKRDFQDIACTARRILETAVRRELARDAPPPSDPVSARLRKRAGRRAIHAFHATSPTPCDGVDLSGLDLSGIDFHYTSLEFADFSGTDLRNANLQNAELAFANFTNAELAGANMRYANVSSSKGIPPAVIQQFGLKP